MKTSLVLTTVLSLLFATTHSLPVTAQGLVLAQGFNGSLGTGIGPVITDDTGNLYIVGGFSGSIDVDQGPGVYTLTGDYSMFLLKENSQGNFIWVKQFNTLSGSGNPGYEGEGQLKRDQDGSFYITGVFEDSVDADPGPNVYKLSTEGQDYYIIKLDASGNFVWAKSTSNTPGNTIGGVMGMDLDRQGHIYVTFQIVGAVDVDPGPGSVVLNGGLIGDIGIAKFDTSGDFIWIKQIGSVNGSDLLYEIALDSAANIYGAGRYEGTVDFDPGPGIFNLTSAGDYDIAVVKLDSAGNFQWAKSIGGNQRDIALDIAVDRWGNVAVTGYYNNMVDFDPGPGVSNLTGSSSRDMFTLRLRTNGDFSWAQSAHPGGIDEGRAIAFDTVGAMYTTGLFSGGGDFDPGPGVYPLQGGVYVQKLDSSGIFAWARGWEADLPGFIGLDQGQNIYVTGTFSGFNADFDPGPGTFFLSGPGGFIEKLCPGVPLSITSTTLNGGTIIVPVGTAVPISGAGSIINGGPVPTPYQVIWSNNGVPFDTTYDAFSITYTATMSGLDTIRATLSAQSISCSEPVTAYVVVISNPLGINGLGSGTASAIEVYPNPANDHFTINGLDINASLRLTDLSGRVLRNWTVMSKQQDYDINALIPGYYLLIIEDGQHRRIATRAVIKR